MYSGTDLIGFIQGGSTATLIIYALFVIGQWKVFEKAGEEGWKSLIPIYNVYVMYKIADINIIKVIVMGILVIIIGSLLTASGSGFLAFIGGAAMLATLIYFLVIAWRFCGNLSRNFGHDNLFAFGLFILQPIFLTILGFNGDEYEGYATPKNAENVKIPKQPDVIVVEQKH